jgi:hypothetical protein
MTAKMVYASCALAIYISGEDLDDLLKGDDIWPALFVEKEAQMNGYAHVFVNPATAETIKNRLTADREAIAIARQKYLVDHPKGRPGRPRKVIE